MDAKYLRLFVDLCRTLTTRRWSLGTGCDEELEVHGLGVHGVVGRSRDLCSCRHDSPGLLDVSLTL